MANKKTDSSNSPRSDDPVHPTKGGLSAKPITASATAGAEPRLDTRFHRTSRDSSAPNLAASPEEREPTSRGRERVAPSTRRRVGLPEQGSRSGAVSSGSNSEGAALFLFGSISGLPSAHSLS